MANVKYFEDFEQMFKEHCDSVDNAKHKIERLLDGCLGERMFPPDGFRIGGGALRDPRGIYNGACLLKKVLFFECDPNCGLSILMPGQQRSAPLRSLGLDQMAEIAGIALELGCAEKSKAEDAIDRVGAIVREAQERSWAFRRSLAELLYRCFVECNLESIPLNVRIKPDRVGIPVRPALGYGFYGCCAIEAGVNLQWDGLDYLDAICFSTGQQTLGIKELDISSAADIARWLTCHVANYLTAEQHAECRALKRLLRQMEDVGMWVTPYLGNAANGLMISIAGNINASIQGRKRAEFSEDQKKLIREFEKAFVRLHQAHVQIKFGSSGIWPCDNALAALTRCRKANELAAEVAGTGEPGEAVLRSCVLR